MVRMLDDLLDVSRIALGKVSVQMEPVGVQELLNDILEEQRARIGRAGLSLEVHIDDNPCSVNADRVRLRQVLDNLFSNAIKFTPSGGTIHLSLAKEGTFAASACAIQVWDSMSSSRPNCLSPSRRKSRTAIVPAVAWVWVSQSRAGWRTFRAARSQP